MKKIYIRQQCEVLDTTSPIENITENKFKTIKVDIHLRNTTLAWSI